MRKHVAKILNHQRDILSPQAAEAVQAAMVSCQKAVAENADQATLEKQMEDLEKAANKWLKPYPNAAWRENVEVLLVALAVAMGIRTFFLQPFKIPTGSMQPTLFGVTSVPDFSRGRDPAMEADMANLAISTGWQRIREWFAGVSYIHIVAERDGPLQSVERPVRILIFNLWQKVVAGGKTFMIWFPPDYGTVPLEARAGLQSGKPFRKGEDIIKLRAAAGDHLFVDRMTYNFRKPKRGEIIVFETKGIDNLPQDQFYIKRMVAMGGEQVQLGDDRHLIINGKRLDASTPHFENVYSFNPDQSPRDSHYSGHVNSPHLAPYFQGKPDGVLVPPNHYMVMGDNTMNSLDSRAWGDFPATNVIGKSFFVYWPITDRFGWGNR
ncbi:MAG TPA: signal peptidase I [Verrucomicrobiota bacterium]|nr:signal peptidase I [Verrucomicrobiota bacterium]